MRRAAIILAIMLTPWTGTAQVGPRLGPGDALRLQIRGHADISGVYEIGPVGFFTIPGVGRIDARDGDFAALEARIGTVIEDVLGLDGPAFDLSVERLRPIAVSGSVANPGVYPYEIDMRVAHAIAASGGWRHRLSENPLEAIELAREQNRLETVYDTLAADLARARRLRSELDEALPPSTPSDRMVALVGRERASELSEQARQQARDRIDIHRSTLLSIDERSRINESEIAAQTAAFEALRQELVLLRAEVERLAPVAERGNVTNIRMLDLRRDLVETEGQVSAAAESLNQARTSGVLLESERKTSGIARRLELISELARVETEIHRGYATAAAIEDGLADADRLAVLRETGIRDDDCGVLVLRSGAAAAEPADAMTLLHPGDLVHVGRRRRDCPTPFAAAATQ